MNKFDASVFVDLIITMDRFLNVFNSKEKDFLIYHYASIDNTLSITSNFICRVAGSTFYHSKYIYLSDTTEGKEVDRLYALAVNKYCDDNQINNNIRSMLLDLKTSDNYICYFDEVPGITNAGPKQCDAYICCFSIDGDSEYMWDTYLKGSRSGFALGFSVADIISNANQSFGKGYKHVIQRIIYSEEDKINHIYCFLHELLSRTDSEKTIKFYVQYFLNMNKFIFKDEKFSPEKEVRSIIFYPKDGKCTLSTIKEGRIIPFKFDFSTPIIKTTYFYSSKEENKTHLISQFKIDNLIEISKYSKD